MLFPPFFGFFCITNPTLFLHNCFMSKHMRIFQLGSFGNNTLLYREPSRWEWRDATPQASRQGEPNGRERVKPSPRVGRDADPRSGEPKAEPSGSERVQCLEAFLSYF